VIDGRFVDTRAFMPNVKTAASRSDGGAEVSVNWEDTSEVQGFTLADLTVARYGAARLARAIVDDVSAHTPFPDALACERKRARGNPHHGNIVYRASMPKRLHTMIAAALGLRSELISRG